MSRRQNSLMRFSRTERLAQLSEQEIVIERKKKEILAKLEAQKKKVSEVLRKTEPTEEINSDKSKFSENLLQNRDECQREKNKEKLVDKSKNERLTNAFSNDGSFLDQFKKLTKSNAVQNTSEVESRQSREENLRSEGSTKTVKDAYKSLGVNFQSSFLRKSLDSNTQLPLSPPQVVQMVTANQASQMSPLNQNSASVLPVSFEMQPSQSATNSVKFNSASKQFPPVQVSDYGSGLEGKSIGGAVSSFSSPLSAFSHSSKSSFKSSHNIPPTSKKSELPKVRSESISMTLKNNSVKRLEAIPNPLDIDDEEVLPPAKKSQFVFTEKKEDCRESGGNFLKNSDSHLPMRNTPTHGDSSNVSSALTKGKKNEKEDGDYSEEVLHKWAKLVAQYGDDFEDILQERNDSDLRFLKKKDSKAYLTYRDLVLKYRSNFNPLPRETGKQTDRSPTSYSPQCEAEDLGSKIKFSKQGPVDLGEGKKYLNYTADTEAVSVNENTMSSQVNKDETLSYYKMPESGAEKDCFLSFQKQIYQEGPENENSHESIGEITEQAKTEERRKRKRKSRWGDAVANASTSGSEANLTLQPLRKLPAPKSTLLTQLTRSDPGLIQYAKQTFGSTNLSEEDWKKAEDHYKINLLYQDMVRKRAEVEKLERQGKFKYEYDSDEDTEGGTWEHKLRQQEMQATQLWAEELTRQAAGKHHIGDFLPPEELERFMEKYNAVKQGREPDLSDYKKFKLKEDNIGYRLLQKMGWNEGQGLGQDGSGITNPVNKAVTRHENQGLGVERPDGLEPGDDEYDAYRKRMMLAYRFRPNPLNNPRRPYY